MAKEQPYVARVPVFDSTRGVYYEQGVVANIDPASLEKDPDAEPFVQDVKDPWVKATPAAVKRAAKQEIAAGTIATPGAIIHQQPGPQPDHRVPVDLALVDEDEDDLEIEKPTPRAKADAPKADAANAKGEAPKAGAANAKADALKD